MTAQILDGKALASHVLEGVRAQVLTLHARAAITPKLAVVLVGDNPASHVYVTNKARAAQRVGIEAQTHHYPDTLLQDDLEAILKTLNADRSVHGILIQLPLPKHLDSTSILAQVDPCKDVDGFHPINAGLLALGTPRFVPCTPQGCMMLINQALGANLRGLRATVLGRSSIVGRPMASLLLAADCTVTIAHSGTQDVASACNEADILVTAVGRPNFVQGEWIKKGATVIDVGINRVPQPNSEEQKSCLVGDVAFADACTRAGAITPVPGGVGPLTVACLMVNTVQAAERLTM